MKRLVFFLLAIAIQLAAQAPWQIGTPVPPLLDLQGADVSKLVPSDPRDPAQVEASRLAWALVLSDVKEHPALRLLLPLGPFRVALLLAASQALRAQSPDQKLYLSFDPEAGQIWDETAWGAVDGGVLVPGDLGPDPNRFRDMLARAQKSFPGRSWTMWMDVDPGPQLSLLMGDGGLLVAPAGGPAEKLLLTVPAGFTDVEGGYGDLILRSRGTGKALRWRFENGAWKSAALLEDRHEVSVTNKDTYNVGALLGKMRGTQLRDRTAIRTVEARLDVDLHLQGERGPGSDMGFTFFSFEKAGEAEELLQKEVRFNGIRANIKGEVQMPIVESRASLAAPVALGLTERFRYRDGGGAGSGKRRILFEPVDKDPLIYQGELLVDEGTGRILAERSSRAELPGIVKTEKRILIYGEPAPGLWRLLRLEMYERWVTPVGVTQVQRRLTYSAFLINDPGFESGREKARVSGQTMLKQTLEGVRYFTKQQDGSRKIESKLKASGRSLGVVIIAAPGMTPPVFAWGGLAYFNFNAFDRGIQVNAITAGVFNIATVFVPSLFAGFDLGMGSNAMLLSFPERPVKDGKLQDKDAVDRSFGGLHAILGHDLGMGLRFEATGNGQYNRYKETKNDKFRTADFALPPSGWTWSIMGKLSWQQKGLQVSGSYGKGWRPEGMYGTPAQPQTIPDEGRYSFWGGSIGYDHRFTSNWWIHGEVGLFAGKGFDRFLSLESGDMEGRMQVAGIRLNSVTSDRITYGKMGLVLPPTAKLRLSLSLEHARARSLDDRKTYGLTGLGISGDLPGFWFFTTVRVDLGIGLQSDIPGVRTVSGFVALMKMF